MKYHLFQFKDSPNFNNHVHDLLNIYFKKDPDFIYYYDKTLEDAYQFIEDNLNDSDKCLVLYCQRPYCENDRELLIYLQKYNDQKIKLKILFFSFDWWYRGDENWIKYTQNLFTAENHYVVTFAPDLDILERIHQQKYEKYLSHIIFNNIWTSYDSSFQLFNNNPIEKIAVSGAINFNYPERQIIYSYVLGNDPRFHYITYQNNELHTDINQSSNYTNRLSEYLCNFASSPYTSGSNVHNLHLITLKYFEILASGSLLLCPATEEPYLKQIGLIAGTHYIKCDMNRIHFFANYILDPKNRKIVDEVRLTGHQFAKDNLNSEKKYLEIKHILNKRFTQ